MAVNQAQLDIVLQARRAHKIAKMLGCSFPRNLAFTTTEPPTTHHGSLHPFKAEGTLGTHSWRQSFILDVSHETSSPPQGDAVRGMA
jgi:hypothetical protein